LLSKELFKTGLKEIEIAFDNFTMTPEKAKVWYKYCNYLSDQDFKVKIKNCIRGCRRNPTLADIIDWKGYFIDGKLDDDLKSRQQEEEWQAQKEEEKIPPRSRKTTIEVYKILSNINPKYREELKQLEKGNK